MDGENLTFFLMNYRNEERLRTEVILYHEDENPDKWNFEIISKHLKYIYDSEKEFGGKTVSRSFITKFFHVDNGKYSFF